ncbi:carbohydrate sulfotransferase 1-like [Amphibalanus amphitrite]|uniref:carbohydrate sulfotransferase 1-like n=1 Tax=Amphibalanus amphitrite TaxID=1232801 RepID=UPI001C91E3BE|nr:carbohydrate sulfotransferase 1-like [Amphibalanus amphitrite]
MGLGSLFGRRGTSPARLAALAVLVAASFLGLLQLVRQSEMIQRRSNPVLDPTDLPAATEGFHPQRVLLLAYMRSGSSFTAELLTLHPDFNYLFEPLWRFNDRQLVPGYSSGEMDESRASYLSALYDCDPLMTVEALKDGFVDRVRFLVAECRQRHLLAKVIRASGGTLRRLLEKQPRLKVIHLVRDPRATVSSRSEVGAKDSAALYCAEIRQHLNVTGPLAASDPRRYALVRYEDLADRSTQRSKLRRLYHFMDLPMPEDALDQYIASHYQPIDKSRLRRRPQRKAKKDNFDTKKRSDFNPNSWKDKLSDERLREIEFECGDVMKRFGYEFTQPT